MTNYDDMRQYLKRYTVVQLKKEIMKFKNKFRVSKLRRSQLEYLIISYRDLFSHLFRGDIKRSFTKD